MSWKDILKGEREYSFYLQKIERLEKLIEKLYNDIEQAAIELSERTQVPLEEARNTIKNMQGDTITMMEATLQVFREELKGTLKDDNEMEDMEDLAKLIERVILEITRDMQDLESKPEEEFTADIMRVKLSSYKDKLEKIIGML
mgnify:CR=1 FL=1